MKKILLVEDTAHLAEEVADILKMEGFEVRVATNGIHGLELISEAKPDLIITDLLMPGMDGFEFIRNVRSQPDLKSIPIVVLSAKTAQSDRISVIEAGADSFIQKPCKAHELIASINSLLVNR